jgi:tetratricopeptide (TPR) repeat protein
MVRKCFAIAVFVVAWSGVAAAEVQWREETFSQLLQRAQKENKYVFVDFYATWCGPCHRLDKETFPDASVGALLNSMLPVEYDAEKGAGLELAKTYKVHAYPTLLVIGPDGKEVDRHLGFMEPAEFVTTIGGFTKNQGTLASLQDELRAKPDDADLLYQVGMKYADAGRPGDAAPVLTKAMALDPQDAKGRNAEMLYAMGEANYNDSRYAEARTYFDRLVKDYPNSDMVIDGMERLASTEYKLGNRDAAVAAYWKVVEKNPDDPSTLNGFAWFCAQRKIGLEQALPTAQKAAELSKRDPGILDTLAEVYFAMGDFDNAIKVGEEALASNPKDTYYNDQVAKFKKAKAEADQARR